MKSRTLSRMLFVRIAPTILVTIALISGFAFHSADKEINTVYDAQLISNANVLWTLVADEISELEDDDSKPLADVDLRVATQSALNDPADEYSDSRMFRVWRSSNVIMRSDTAFSDAIGKQPSGFSTLSVHRKKWRIYSLPIPDLPLTIEVGEKMDLRHTLATNILFNLSIPLLLMIPVLAALIWYGIHNGLGQILGLVEQIRKRSPNDLSHVNTRAMPRDLAPLGKSLNQLFSQLEYSFTAEKRFTDHAAHQLRTPQAIIKLQLQMLAEATQDDEKISLIRELMQSNDRATKLVDMLLTSARLAHQSILVQPVNFYRVAASVMAELGVLANDKQIELSLDGAEDSIVMADDSLLKMMTGNLIENAIKYTPPHGTVAVNIVRSGTFYLLSVSDTGPGIAEEERELVFERFYRIATPQAEGSGLGLAIVAEIVQRLSGKIALSNAPDGQGLRVDVMIPAAE